MNIEDFLTAMNNDRITGEFDLKTHNDEVMDRDFENITFEDCTIIGGDFASSSFYNCSFKNVIFQKSALVGVTFTNCSFKNIRFNDTQTSFTIS
jgi:uncharacterized protein YjbI with pentapeptide repeats